MYKFLLNFIVVLFLFLGLEACKSAEEVSSSSEEADRDRSRMEEIYWARVDSARMAFSESDVNFMTGMIGHHAQAIVISRLAPENDASAQIQVLAARIINAQQDEIASMQRWLRDRDQPVPKIHIDGLNLMIHGVDHHHNHMNMPGMLSQEQIEELSESRGAEFDRLFLKYMIEHHQGAVIMVKDLFNTDDGALEDEAFRLASDIQVDQITEIERMKLMLENLSNS